MRLWNIWLAKIYYSDPFYTKFKEFLGWAKQREYEREYIAFMDESMNFSIQGPDGKWVKIK